MNVDFTKPVITLRRAQGQPITNASVAARRGHGDGHLADDAEGRRDAGGGGRGRQPSRRTSRSPARASDDRLWWPTRWISWARSGRALSGDRGPDGAGGDGRDTREGTSSSTCRWSVEGTVTDEPAGLAVPPPSTVDGQAGDGHRPGLDGHVRLPARRAAHVPGRGAGRGGQRDRSPRSAAWSSTSSRHGRDHGPGGARRHGSRGDHGPGDGRGPAPLRCTVNGARGRGRRSRRPDMGDLGVAARRGRQHDHGDGEERVGTRVGPGQRDGDAGLDRADGGAADAGVDRPGRAGRRAGRRGRQPAGGRGARSGSTACRRVRPAPPPYEFAIAASPQAARAGKVEVTARATDRAGRATASSSSRNVHIAARRGGGAGALGRDGPAAARERRWTRRRRRGRRRR